MRDSPRGRTQGTDRGARRHRARVGIAAVTAYWLAGGTALLDTVGGAIEQWGRRRGTSVLAVLSVVVAVKLAVAVVPLVVDRLPDEIRRWTRAAAWVAAAVLVAYGGLLTVVGVLVVAGVVPVAADADRTALAWHALLWDPWFLAWGCALGVWLRWTRDRASPRARAARAR